MRSETKQALHKIRETLTEAARYDHAGSLLTFDMETICPPKAMEEQGDLVLLADHAPGRVHHVGRAVVVVRRHQQHWHGENSLHGA